jgi:hypothetical protein
MRTVLGAGIVAAAALVAVLPVPAPLIEQYFSAGWYPRVQQRLTPLSNLAPFAFFDLIVLAVVVVAVSMLAAGVVQARRERRLAPVPGAVARLVILAAALYLAFLAIWGLNYRRIGMADRLVLDAAPPHAAAVTQLGSQAVEELNRLHAEAHRSGWPGNEWQDEALREAFADTQRLLVDTPPAVPGRMKWTVFGPYFRWASVDGMVDPFALEVLGNPDLLPWERPFVLTHEWAHLAGFAHEAEASFVGWLTCVRGNAVARYSGWLYLYWQVASEVPGPDRGRLAAQLDEGPRRDIAAISERLLRGQFPLLRRASWAAYDQYLRANRVDSGIRSYGEVVNLILRASFEAGWVPVRRHPPASP